MKATARPRRAARYAFRLYVAGSAPHSARALKNLESLCRQHIGDDFELDVVDVLQEPLRALNEGIFVTPTLIRLAPEPSETLIGDLSEEAAVLRTLGLVSLDSA